MTAHGTGLAVPFVRGWKAYVKSIIKHGLSIDE